MLIVLKGSYPPDSWIKNLGHPNESSIHSHYVKMKSLGPFEEGCNHRILRPANRAEVKKSLKKECSLETIKCLTSDFVEDDSDDLQYIQLYQRDFLTFGENSGPSLQQRT